MVKKYFIFLGLLCFLLVGLWACSSQNIPHPSGTQSQSRSKTTAKGIDPKVLNIARKAQHKVRKSGVSIKEPLVIIDYSLPSSQKRLWIIDAQDNVLFHTYVAHGRGSGNDRATHFSDLPGSTQTSIGVFVTGKPYYGRHGRSLALHGLEAGYNAHAYQRRIVIHSADYVSPDVVRRMGRLGRSWGCPALEKNVINPIIDLIQDGAVILAYYPDNQWLKKSQYIS